MRRLPVLALSLSLTGCSWLRQTFATNPGPKAAAGVPRPIAIKSFSDTVAVNALVASGKTLWVGTPRGLIKWDVEAGTSSRVTARDGLPGNRVTALLVDGANTLWVATSGGLAHQVVGKGGATSWRSFPNPPVGESVTAIARAGDGTLWFGGPAGLAHLVQGGRYDRLLGATAVTALAIVAAQGNEEVWVGTAEHGIARVAGDKVEVFGPPQGADLSGVESLAADGSALVAVGGTKGERRVAYWDGFRFYSYRLDGALGPPAWTRKIGEALLVGAGPHAYAIAKSEQPRAGGAVRLVAVPLDHPKPPWSGPSHEAAPELARLAETAPASPPGAKPAPAPTSEKAEPPPSWTVKEWGPALPDRISAVAPDGAALWVGTRFLGASRIEPDKATPFRLYDLAADAERLSVACGSESDCWVATGLPTAWHFDGDNFESAEIDPEKGSAVLAVVEPPHGPPMAIHRGASDNILRFSSVADGRWSPIGFHEVTVPEGVPDIPFAVYAPDGHLWVGLRYVDLDGDRVDYGAAEIDLDHGRTLYHRQLGVMSQRNPSLGWPLPNDVGSAYFKAADDAWFGARTGAVHVERGVAKTYTEANGLESEIVHGIVEGPDGEIWIATAHGVGRFDGEHWRFPAEGDELRVKATSIARDRFGAAHIGSRSGLLLAEPPPSGSQLHYRVQTINSHRGLLDDNVLALAVDKYGRVWALTEKGISVVER